VREVYDGEDVLIEVRVEEKSRKEKKAAGFEGGEKKFKLASA